MLDGKHNAIYRPLVAKAWAAHCARTLVSIEDKIARNLWYRKALLQEFGVYTTKQLRQDEPTFDSLCLYFSTLAGDQEQIGYWSRADERRALWRLKQTMQRAHVDMHYVRGIARKMNMGDKPIESLPAELILKLNTALFLHTKRHAASSANSACRESSSILSPEDDPELSFP